MRRLQSFPSWLGIVSFSISSASVPTVFIISSSSASNKPDLKQGVCVWGGLLVALSHPFVFLPEVGSYELEQKILEGVQAPLGVPQGSIRTQLGSQEEQLPVLGHGAQRQGVMQLRHAHSVRLIL